MKTTLREAFWNMDNSTIDENNYNTESTDIDCERIKADVLSRINAGTKQKARPKKQFKTILIAAVLCVILALGATAIYASGSIEYIFKEFFGGNMNSAGLYDSGKVTITSGDEDYNINLLGVTGDSKKIYAAIEVTKKDGTAFTDEGYSNPYMIITLDDFDCTFECTDKNGNVPERCNGKVEYSLSEDGKVLKLCVLAMNGDENMDLKDGTMHLSHNRFGAVKILEKIAKRVDMELANQMGAGYGWDIDSSEIDERIAQVEASLDEQGITDYTTYTTNDNELCIVQQKVFPLSFEMSFELSYETDRNITRTLTAEDAPDYITEDATEVKMEITPFGVNLYGKCDPAITSARPDESYCYKVIDYSSRPRVVLEDGTVYYLYQGGLDTEGVKDGYYTEEKVFNLSTNNGPAHYEAQINLINPEDVAQVIINGNTVYNK